MAKKDDAPAISLFSFQDIITSLTGIMFLIVLLLIVFMLEMPEKKAENPQSPEETSSVGEIRGEIGKIRQQLRKMKDRENVLQQRIRELKELSPEQIQMQYTLLQAEAGKQQRIVAVTSRKTDQNREISRELESKKELLKKTADALKTEVENLERRIQEHEKLLKAEIAQSEAIRRAIRFKVDNSSALQPVIVEFSRNSIRALECVSGKTIDIPLTEKSVPGQKKAFLDWVQSRNRNDEYYTVLVKPETFDCADLVNYLGVMGKSRGLELLPENDISIFGGQ